MPNPNLAFATVLASTLADLGVEHACISPGSRNTPLIAGFAAENRIRSWPILDERSAGFFGVGLAKATGRPVVLACTSGTAAAEYHAAVIEASQSDVPLLVLTADRPEELRGIDSPQTIDQIGLFGSSVRLFIDAPAPDDMTTPRDAVELARRAWAMAATVMPGPVHLNLPFREPLLDDSPAVPIRAEGPPGTTPHSISDLGEIATAISGRKGLIVAGRSNDPDFPAACAELAAATGSPVIADPLSGLRHGTHPIDLVLAYSDALASAGALDTLWPDVVIRLGPIPTSKATWSWLRDHPDVEQIVATTAGRDATSSATTVLAAPPTPVARALASAVTASAPAEWTAAWQQLDTAAGNAIESALRHAPFPNEPAIARLVLQNSPAGSFVTAGSSMPIRDVDTFGGKSKRPIRLFGNRGTNGIDGVVSAALGTAASGQPAVVLLGDVSMFHDLNALGSAVQLSLPITIVVVHNDGGGIFHFLSHNNPDVMNPDTFETYLATPHQTDFVAVARALGLETLEVVDRVEFAGLISAPATGPRLIQLRTDRHKNLELHREIATAVKQILA
jgi:2-succinyl-5-enolpyruvyl-6-hydroxy-3-cyclohexene-1-carboxylate synthase